MYTIDFHAHPIPESFKEGLNELEIDPIEDDGFPLPEWTIESQLEFMKQAKIDYTILSLPSPHIHNGDDEKSSKVARKINDELEKICKMHQQQLGYVACLPLPNVSDSIKEIKRTMDEMHALGVKVPTNCNGVYLGDEKLDPVMEELNKRNALVIIHPNRGISPRNVITGKTAALYEYPVDTTRAVLNMIANNIMVRYPNIKFIIPHVGSFLPYMYERMNGISKILASKGLMQEVDVKENMKNLYFDLAGDPEPYQLDMLLMITDKYHIVYGTDYPHSPAPVIINKKRHLEQNKKYQEELERFYNKNAQELLKGENNE